MPASAIRMRTNNSKGFTLIELMIVMAIIGILASLAVSAYQTYTVRAQVSEGINFAASVKVPVVETYNLTGVPPADRLAVGLSANPADTSGNYVSGLAIADGRIDITFGNNVHQDAFGDTLSVTPYLSGSNTVVWRCGYSAAPAGSTAMSGGGVTSAHQDPTLDSRYLPAACRQ